MGTTRSEAEPMSFHCATGNVLSVLNVLTASVFRWAESGSTVLSTSACSSLYQTDAWFWKRLGFRVMLTTSQVQTCSGAHLQFILPFCEPTRSQNPQHAFRSIALKLLSNEMLCTALF